jgi:SAM-dependent methyltransferase
MSNLPLTSDPFTDGWDITYQNTAPTESTWSDDPQPFVRKVLNSLSPGSMVLDIGAGDGRNTKVLLDAGHVVTALDISTTALATLQKRVREARYRQPILVHGKVESMPLGSDQFDAILAADVLPQTVHTTMALQEMRRVLKPSGLCFVDVFTPRDCAFGEGEEISPKRFAYKGTVFCFFERGDLERSCAEFFDVVEVEPCTWMDPPHGAFRPYAHRHDALFYTLRKR